MPPPTLSERLDNLYTTTWQNMKAMLGDNIFDATPFWFWMRANGKLDSIEGGRWIGEALRYAKSDNVKWITKGGTVTLSDKEFITTAQYNWRYLVDSIVRFGVDEQQNRGRNAIISLMNAKIDNSKDSLADELEIRLAGTAGTDEMNGLQDIVPDDPTVTGSTLGGIDPSVYTWWRNQFKDMTGLSFTSVGLKWMSNMLNNCGQNLRQDFPDFILVDQTNWERYELEVIEQKRITEKTLGDAGFKNIEYKGLPMVWSPQLTNRMYFLNTRFLRLKYDPTMFFDMTRWKEIPDQVLDRAAQIILAANLVTSRRRVHGVLFNLDTD